MIKKRILLHACCAPCAGYVIQKLLPGYDLTVYYYNPNIYPYEEYYRRRDELQNYCIRLGITFIEEEYDQKRWHENIQGLEHEPERGRRCDRCFNMRLEKAASYAAALGYDFFTTTLTVSPHKKSSTIIAIGSDIGRKHDIGFLAEDFKKKEGYKLANEISKREGFYRQAYCGCLYSKKE